MYIKGNQSITFVLEVYFELVQGFIKAAGILLWAAPLDDFFVFFL